VLAYEVPRSGTQFENAGTLIGPTLSKKGHFETSIAHPFGIVFENAAIRNISNQDTNVVSQVDVTGGSLGAVSPYLKDLFPTGTFLSGTYVASQVGSLPDVNVLTTAVDHVHGGLGVSFDSSGKVRNSVRDVAIANGILFVCDEPEKVVDLYALADGRYLGSSTALSTSPTHLATNNGGLYVSAGSNLYWGPLPQSASAASISLQAVALTPPSSKDPLKIGGISFDGASRLYIPFQEGTGDSKKAGGSIYGYGVSSQNPPVPTGGTAFVASLPDTPEFVLYWPGN
jgi:hypothetical protein